MLTLVKAPQAEADLIDIWLYVSEDQPLNADRLLDRLDDAAKLISEIPKMGDPLVTLNNPPNAETEPDATEEELLATLAKENEEES